MRSEGFLPLKAKRLQTIIAPKPSVHDLATHREIVESLNSSVAVEGLSSMNNARGKPTSHSLLKLYL